MKLTCGLRSPPGPGGHIQLRVSYYGDSQALELHLHPFIPYCPPHLRFHFFFPELYLVSLASELIWSPLSALPSSSHRRASHRPPSSTTASGNNLACPLSRVLSLVCGPCSLEASSLPPSTWSPFSISELHNMKKLESMNTLVSSICGPKVWESSSGACLILTIGMKVRTKMYITQVWQLRALIWTKVQEIVMRF
ncbi:uncharacterized protein LOC129290899 [Prosopis cineraria]|uniref:uncharacterized protein LOC129290899 n=1 Tax=Prosopis cineraria TaxID=364024 RepID=UPI00240EC3CC|nr:uncharacterized protein LOC129290899 [Prosopis cineraria]